MKVQPIDSRSFASKNTYLQKSKYSVTKLERDYFKSLHKEAIARRAYLDFNKAEFDLVNYDGNMWRSIKLFSKMVSNKLRSVIYETSAYNAFPNRFVEPDDKLADPWRHYHLKSFSTKMPSAIINY